MEEPDQTEMRIKAAAIRYDGKVYEGKRHHLIGHQMIADGVCIKFPGGDDQGFVTECGLYVRRAPALQIAISAGQVEEGKTFNKEQLFSEDLW